MIDVAFMNQQKAWSTKTFGPGHRTVGILAHIRAELGEIEAAPLDIEEWADVVILALDGAWRTGATAEEILSMIRAKAAKNAARTWPDWREFTEDEPILHVKAQEDAWVCVVCGSAVWGRDHKLHPRLGVRICSTCPLTDVVGEDVSNHAMLWIWAGNHRADGVAA